MTLPEPVIEQIIAKAQGVPLFVEEITRSVLASGILEERDGQYHPRDADASFVIPATLQDSLVARLDRLGPVEGCGARRIDHRTGVLVRTCRGPCVARAPAAWRRALERLVQSDIVEQRGEPPNAIYSFKHALLRDAAYQTILKSRKRDLHRRVAETLEARFPGRGAERARGACPPLHRGGKSSTGPWTSGARRPSGPPPAWRTPRRAGHIRSALALISALAGGAVPRRVGAGLPHARWAGPHGPGGMGQPDGARHLRTCQTARRPSWQDA